MADNEWLTELSPVLFLGAHPDDTEGGAGGLMCRLAKLGVEFYNVVFSNCEEQPGNIGICKEWMEAQQRLGVKNFKMLNFPNTNFPKYTDEIRAALEQLKKEIKPRLVIVHSRTTIHQDHKTLAKEAHKVFRYASILGYHDPKSCPYFQPALFFKLSEEEVKAKLFALDSFETQKKQRTYYQIDAFKSTARYHGLFVGENWAEGFEVVNIKL